MDFMDFIMNVTWQIQCKNWMNHMATNMPKILKGRDIAEIPKKPLTPCLIIGGGPSIYYEDLNKLRKWKYRIICCDKMLIPLLKYNIIPEIVTSVDGSLKIKEFYQHRLVRRHRDKIKFIFCVQTTNPEVIDLFDDYEDFYWYVGAWDNPQMPLSASNIFHLQTHKTIMATGGNVGAFSWYLANYLQHVPIGIIGLDYSYGEEKDPRKTTYFETFNTLSQGKIENFVQYYKRVTTWAGKEVLTDMIFITYFRLFTPSLQQAKNTINLGQFSILTPENVLTMPLDNFLSKYQSKINIQEYTNLEPTLTVVDDLAPIIQKDGIWQVIIDNDAVGSSFSCSNRLNDKILFKFKGSNIWIRFFADANSGVVSIKIDNNDALNIDLYNPTPMFKYVPIPIAIGIPESMHTIELTVIGARNSQSANCYVGVDSFAYQTKISASDKKALEKYAKAKNLPPVEEGRSLLKMESHLSALANQ